MEVVDRGQQDMERLLAPPMPLVREMLDAETLAVDTETTGLQLLESRDHITGISLCDGRRAVYLPVAHPDAGNPEYLTIVRAGLRARFHQGRRTFLHHAVFDFIALGLTDLTGDGLLDTKCRGWLEDENRPSGLKFLGEHLFGIPDTEAEALRDLMRGLTKKEALEQARASGLRGQAALAAAETAVAERPKRGWGDLLAQEIWAYAAQDAWLTYLLGTREGFGEPDRAAPYRTTLEGWQRESRFQFLLTRLNSRGMPVNHAYLEDQASQVRDQMDRIQEEFRQLTGRDDFNLRSNADKAHLLYEVWGLPVLEVTPSGSPSTARTVLERLQGHHRGVSRILDFQRLSKALSAFYGPLLEAGDRVHTWLSSTGTVTGRLSSRGPNLQTIPKEGVLPGVRHAFQAPPGYHLIEADLAGAELRVMAAMAREAAMVEALERGLDLHGMTAEAVFGPGYDELQRRTAKNLMFGWAYGIGPRKFATYLPGGPTPENISTAADMLRRFEARYPALNRLSWFLQNMATEEGFVPHWSWSGRARRFQSPFKEAAPYTALNAVVQGGVAELMKDVMLALPPELEPYMVLQVHDSLVFELPDEALGFDLGSALQQVLDDVNPFPIRMTWEVHKW